MCVTVFVVSEEDEGDEEGDAEEEQEQEVVTVVYFWQGKEANNMGWLHFTHRWLYMYLGNRNPLQVVYIIAGSTLLCSVACMHGYIY